MSNLILKQLLFKNHNFLLCATTKRGVRSPFHVKPLRPFEERNKQTLEAHKNKRLVLAERLNLPDQFKPRDPPPERIPIKKERKLPKLHESQPPYQKYSEEDIKQYENTTWFDPLFNPHLHEGRNRVNPDEEPFNAVYSDSKSELANEYTKVKNITTPELWKYVERLERIKIAPMPDKRKLGAPLEATPSGYIPPPESPPDLPYFIPRTRNYLLPVYYQLDSDPEKCYTLVKTITGDIWQLEEDLRSHLESLNNSKKRILTSVQETDGRILFRGKHLHEVVSWLHEKGF